MSAIRYYEKIGLDVFIATGCGDYGNLQAYQIGRQLGQSIVLALRPAIFYRDVLALDEAGLVQTSPEAAQKRLFELALRECTRSRRPSASIVSFVGAALTAMYWFSVR